jgi:hypothetical protein
VGGSIDWGSECNRLSAARERKTRTRPCDLGCGRQYGLQRDIDFVEAEAETDQGLSPGGTRHLDLLPTGSRDRRTEKSSLRDQPKARSRRPEHLQPDAHDRQSAPPCARISAEAHHPSRDGVGSRQLDAIADIEVIRFARPDDRQAFNSRRRRGTGEPLIGAGRDIADSGHMPDNLEAIELDMRFNARAGSDPNGGPASGRRQSRFGWFALTEHLDLDRRRGRPVVIERDDLDKQFARLPRANHKRGPRLPQHRLRMQRIRNNFDMLLVFGIYQHFDFRRTDSSAAVA